MDVLVGMLLSTLVWVLVCVCCCGCVDVYDTVGVLVYTVC